MTFRVQLYHPHEVRISQQTWPRGLGEEPGEPFLHGNVTEMMSPACTPFQCRMEARSRLQWGPAVGWAPPPRAPCGEWEGRLPSYRVARAAGPLPAPGAPEAAKAKGGERSARGTTPGRGGGSERPRCLRGVALRRHRARRVPGRGRERDAGQVSEEGVRGAPSAGTRGSWLSRHVLCNDIRLRYGEPSVKTPLGSHRVRRGWSCRQRHDEEKVLFVQRLLWRKTLLPP